MSVASALLRVVLMISLLLNGLNAAVAGEPLMRSAGAASTDAGPPCHSHHPGMQQEPAGRQAQAPAEGAHCQIKECVRACAQQPALTLASLLLLPAAYAEARPPAAVVGSHPTPALQRIQRPPIG